MKDLLQSLIRALKGTDLATRVIVAVGTLCAVAVVALAATWAGRPALVPLLSGLDETQFSAVTRALATAGLRYETSSPPGPYSVFVDESRRYEAQNAVHAAGALDLGPRGIPTGGGTSTIFLSKDERDQINLKRNWQELENQLRALAFVDEAVVRISPGLRSPLLARAPATVSVLVRLRGTEHLSRLQRQTLAAIVRNAANVPDENIVIADQFGNSLFDGVRDEALDNALQFERDFVTSETQRAQAFLDRVFGPGMAAVSIVGEWDHDRRETVDESFDPTKLKVSETLSETRTPIEPGVTGGPAGVASSIDQAGAAPAGEVPFAETSENDTRYQYGSKTTHTVQAVPVLQRLAITLTLDSSLAERLDEARSMVEDLVGFQEGRDQMTATALPLAGVARDADGKVLPPEPEDVPAPPSRALTLLLEHGVEVLTAVAFLFVLLRSLRKAQPKPTESGAPGTGARSSGAAAFGPEEEIDVEALARRKIEQMVQDEPERVGVLLSRWALGDTYARSTR